MVQRPTEKLGSGREFQSPGRRGTFLPESNFCADSLGGVCMHSPLCAIACISIFAHVKNPNAGSHTIVWTQENTAHTDSNG